MDSTTNLGVRARQLAIRSRLRVDSWPGLFTRPQLRAFGMASGITGGHQGTLVRLFPRSILLLGCMVHMGRAERRAWTSTLRGFDHADTDARLRQQHISGKGRARSRADPQTENDSERSPPKLRAKRLLQDELDPFAQPTFGSASDMASRRFR